MDHAMPQTHRILPPNGLLINFHGLPVPNVIEVHLQKSVIKGDWLLDRDDIVNARTSRVALSQDVADGDFILEGEQDFGHSIYADDFTEFQEWLSEWWKSAILTDQTTIQLQKLFERQVNLLK
jgi:hypothetical protein